MLPLLTRGEIIRAIRIRKLLEQADSEAGPAGATYQAKALALARGYPRGPALVYQDKFVLGDNDGG